jgi:hypothetical protein
LSIRCGGIVVSAKLSQMEDMKIDDEKSESKGEELYLYLGFQYMLHYAWPE